MNTLSSTYDEHAGLQSALDELRAMPTAEQRTWMQSQLAAEFPHLSVTVEVRDGALFVGAVPA